MLDDQDVLISEMQRLRTAHYRWRAIAIAALALVFVGLVPFTIVFWRLVKVRQARTDMSREEIQYLWQKNKELEKQLQENAKNDGK